MRPLITMMMTVHDIDDDHVVKWEPHQKRIWIYGPGVTNKFESIQIILIGLARLS